MSIGKDSKSDGKHGKKHGSEKPKEKTQADVLKTRTGGAYIPPAKLKLMQEQIADKSSEQYQRINWERLKKKIHRQVIDGQLSEFFVIFGSGILFGLT